MSSPILAGEAFSAEKQQQIAEQFFRDGYVHIPNVLTEGEITALRDKLLDDPELGRQTNPHLADVRLFSWVSTNRVEKIFPSF